MDIITGYRAEAHITAQQDRNVNIGIFGDGTMILAVGSEMEATIISANEVQIADGTLVAQGCTAEIAYGTTESLTITSGTQDMYRTDLIVARYTKDSGTGVESMALVVIEGTPASSSPVTPSYTSGSIAGGDTTVDFPLYKVNIDGITIDSVDCLVDIVSIKDDCDSKSIVANTKWLGTLTADSNGAIDATIDISSAIPTGYKAIAVLERSSGSYAYNFYSCYLASSTTVKVQLIQRPGSSVTSASPSVVVLCTRGM